MKKLSGLKLHLAINYAGGEPINYDEYSGAPIILVDPLEIATFVRNDWNVWGEELLPMWEVYLHQPDTTKADRKKAEHEYRNYYWTERCREYLMGNTTDEPSGLEHYKQFYTGY